MLRAPRPRPAAWSSHLDQVGPGLSLPFHAAEWIWQWTSYYLGRWAFLEVLEYLGTLSVLVAVISYFAASGDRLKQKHYQAWQVVNTAQGKGGSGGRIEALQELNRDRVPLVGLDVSGAFLMGVKLPGASLSRSIFEAADLRHADLSSSDLSYADLKNANLRQAILHRLNFQFASFEEADLTGADLSGSDLSGADLTSADLTGANLKGVIWRNLKSIDKANLGGVKNAPEGFKTWARENGARPD